MSKVMMNMEELEQVNGGNFFTDAWDCVVDSVKGIPKGIEDTLKWTKEQVDKVPLLPDIIKITM